MFIVWEELVVWEWGCEFRGELLELGIGGDVGMKGWESGYRCGYFIGEGWIEK